MNDTAENDFFGISQGKVVMSDRLGGQMCEVSCQFFSGFNMPTIIKIC